MNQNQDAKFNSVQWTNQEANIQGQMMQQFATYQQQPQMMQLPQSLLEPPKNIKAKLFVKLENNERGYYSALLSQCDKDDLGKVPAKVAAAFFRTSGLDLNTLKHIWLLSTDSTDFIARDEFYVALKLISYAQNGIPVTQESIQNSVKSALPKFTHPSTTTPANHQQVQVQEQQIQPQLQQSDQQLVQQNQMQYQHNAQTEQTNMPSTSMPSQQVQYVQQVQQVQSVQQVQQTNINGPSVTDIFQITEPQLVNYEVCFNQYQQNGLVSGMDARELFLKSQLTKLQLHAIWELVDTQRLGKLEKFSFICALHLMMLLKNSKIIETPSTLPHFMKVFIQNKGANVVRAVPIEQLQGQPMLIQEIKVPQQNAVQPKSKYDALEDMIDVGAQNQQHQQHQQQNTQTMGQPVRQSYGFKEQEQIQKQQLELDQLQGQQSQQQISKQQQQQIPPPQQNALPTLMEQRNQRKLSSASINSNSMPTQPQQQTPPSQPIKQQQFSYPIQQVQSQFESVTQVQTQAIETQINDAKSRLQSAMDQTSSQVKVIREAIDQTLEKKTEELAFLQRLLKAQTSMYKKLQDEALYLKEESTLIELRYVEARAQVESLFRECIDQITQNQQKRKDNQNQSQQLIGNIAQVAVQALRNVERETKGGGNPFSISPTNIPQNSSPQNVQEISSFEQRVNDFNVSPLKPKERISIKQEVHSLPTENEELRQNQQNVDQNYSMKSQDNSVYKQALHLKESAPNWDFGDFDYNNFQTKSPEQQKQQSSPQQQQLNQIQQQQHEW